LRELIEGYENNDDNSFKRTTNQRMDYIKVWFNYKNGREVKQVLGLNECKKQDKMHLGTKRKYN